MSNETPKPNAMCGLTRRRLLGVAGALGLVSFATWDALAGARPDPLPPSGMGGIWVLDHDSMSPANQMLAQSIQGITAGNRIGVWLRVKGMSAILEAQLKDEGVKFHEPADAVELLWQFRTSVAGIVIYKLGTPSLNVATSICGPLRAAAIDESLLDNVRELNLPVLADVRGMDEATAFTKYRAMFARAILVEQSLDKPGQLRDFAIAHNAFTFFTHDSKFRHDVIAALGPQAVVYGWGPDELGWISDLSAAQATAGPADWCVNLSQFENLPAGDLGRPARPEVKLEDGARYIAFVLSDGDNIQWLTGGFVDSPTFWANPLRGKIPVTWELSALLAKVGPRVLRHLYSTAKETDGFVAGAGVPGYTYPHLQPDRVALAQQAGPLLRQAQLPVASVLNTNDGSLEDTIPILDLSAVSGVIYKDYAPYNRSGGKIIWHAGKPCISYRFLLWEGIQGPEDVAKEVAKLPTSPLKDDDSFILVQAHAWSYGKTGGPLEAIRRTIELLPANTRVITADQMILLMRAAHSKAGA